jgi:hypothetical protein
MISDFANEQKTSRMRPPSLGVGSPYARVRSTGCGAVTKDLDHSDDSANKVQTAFTLDLRPWSDEDCD